MQPSQQQCVLDRRDWWWQVGGGFCGLALAGLLQEEGLLSGEASESLSLGPDAAVSSYHYPPRAKRVVQLFMAGAASHIDLFDYKPDLAKYHGQASNFGEPVEAFQNGLGPWMKSPFAFQPHGECGKHLSEVVAPLASCVDDLAFVHNVVGKT